MTAKVNKINIKTNTCWLPKLLFCWPLSPCSAWLLKFMLAGSSVLPFALAGRLGGRNCWDGSLVEGSRYFVDVVQGQYWENKTGRYNKHLEITLRKISSSMILKHYKSRDIFQKCCALGACDTYHVVTHTRWTSPEANSDKHRHNRTGW